MNRYITNLGFLTVFTFTMLVSHATIITVKQDGTGDYATIQEGIDAAANYDTVLVWPGIYYENISYKGKEIVVGSLYLTTQDDFYIGATVIDGGQLSSCVLMDSYEGAGTEICGFTIRNGAGKGDFKRGGGLRVRNSVVRIINCIITNNNARAGGGIFIEYSQIYISGTVICYNQATMHGGGILLLGGSEAIFDSVTRCSIYLNYASIGSDLGKSSSCPTINFIIDTFTVIHPDFHFVASYDQYGYPVNDITFDIHHAKINPVMADLYVSPEGSDDNGGLSPGDPLKTVAFALKKMLPDTLSPKTIYVLPGHYSPSLTGEKLPWGLRSYVSIVGEDTASTIIDAESKSFFAYGVNLTRDYTLMGLTFRNGYGNPIFNEISGITAWVNFDVVYKNLHFYNNIGILSSGIQIQFDDYGLFEEIKVNCCKGSGGISIGNGQPGSNIDSTVYYINNCMLDSILPHPDFIDGGGGMALKGINGFPGKEIGYVSNLSATNCIISVDPLWGDGAGSSGLRLSSCAKTYITNSTIGNCSVTGVEGGALGLYDGVEADLYNSINYDNEQHQIFLGYAGDPGQEPVTLNVSYSNIQDGYNGVVNLYNMHTLNWLSGNIDADPMWQQTGDYPYALKAGSPCINAGTPMYEPGMQPPYIIQQDTVYKLITLDYDTIPLPSTDLAGNPRIAYGRIDMGAYEFADTTTGMTNNKYQIANNKVNVFPNPFTSNAFISFQTNTKGKVRVTVYNLNGQLVKKLTETEAATGSCSITWDGTDSFGFEVNPGTYIVRVEVNGQIAGSAKVVKKRKK